MMRMAMGCPHEENDGVEECGGKVFLFFCSTLFSTFADGLWTGK